LADTLRADRMMRRRRGGLRGLPVWRLHRGRQEVIHERPALDVALFVVGDLLVERGRETHGETTMDLTLDDHRVDDRAAVVHRYETADLDLAGPAIDVDDADVRAEGEGEVRWVVVVDRLEPRFHALDRKSTRLNSSHLVISYAVFCLKKHTSELQSPCNLVCRLLLEKKKIQK